MSGEITGRSFAISDDHYGVTAAIYRCRVCGFMQCHDLREVLPYYEQMEDETFDQMRLERSLQQRRLLEHVNRLKKSGHLLDIGAGSGMLVEQAIAMGYQAEGVEPSYWLQSRAMKLGLPVHRGTFPHPDLNPPYDVITMVDILEHLQNPIEILRAVREALKKDGIGMVVTPDAGSLMARFFGFKWWHFRVAHIGYFNRYNLLLALERAGLKVLRVAKPGWYFNADYLIDRFNRYLPEIFQLPVLTSMKKIIIPLNLLDSLLFVFQRAGE